MDWQWIGGLVMDWHRIGRLVMDFQIGLGLALNRWIVGGFGFGPSLVWEWKIGNGLALDWQ